MGTWQVQAAEKQKKSRIMLLISVARNYALPSGFLRIDSNYWGLISFNYFLYHGLDIFL